MPNFGSVFREKIIGSAPKPPRTEILQQKAIWGSPPISVSPDDEEYGHIFTRLADTAILAFRTGDAAELPVNVAERKCVASEITAFIGGLQHYLQHVLDLQERPHVQIELQPGRDNLPIRVFVSS